MLSELVECVFLHNSEDEVQLVIGGMDYGPDRHKGHPIVNEQICHPNPISQFPPHCAFQIRESFTVNHHKIFI